MRMRRSRRQIRSNDEASSAPSLSPSRLSLFLVFLCYLSGLICPSSGATLTNRRSLPFSSRSLAISSQRQSSRSSSSLLPPKSYSRPSQQTTQLCKATKSSKANTIASDVGTKRRNIKKPPTDAPLYFIKVALAGGIAGAVGSAALYPMDAAKTLRQSSPSEYSSVFHALGSLISSPSASSSSSAAATRWQNVYRGVIPATLGAIPSSALYFGAYESMKTLLTRYFPLEDPTTTKRSSSSTRKNNFTNRLLVHALAAMSGNVLSSAVFVPKELIKQQLQYRQAGHVFGVVVDVLKEKGIGGLYVGYKTTLLRNIPTAVLRFSLYEEFRYQWYTQERLKLQKKYSGSNTSPSKALQASGNNMSPKFFLAGAVAGAIASGVMTPVDVLKTRLATGTCPVDVKSCFLLVVREEGIKGLYSGAGARMVFSGAFSAIGFGTFEWAKSVMGVSSTSNVPPINTSNDKVRLRSAAAASSKKNAKSGRHPVDDKKLLTIR